MDKIVIIVGTNASGKSSLAVQLAKQFDGEIISADSRQVYRRLDIATGKVTIQEMDGIPHHLIDIADVHTRYTAADFVRDARAAIADVTKRGKLPIVAGGTGFYVDALVFNLLPNTEPDEELRHTLETYSAEELFAQLQECAPQRARELEEKNEHHLKRRLIRAIEIAQQPQQEVVHVPYDALWIGIQRDKEELEHRITLRTTQRIEDGMIAEAQQLIDSGVSYERLEELGLEYKHLADYLRGVITKKELHERIVIGDRQYAKRQRTWFKRNEDIHWLTPENLDTATTLVESFLE